jgi:hypothetical protein
MATAIDHNRAMAASDQRRHLVAPIAAVAEAAVQQYRGRAGPIRCVPDPGAVVLDVALLGCRRQRRGALRLKFSNVVVVCLHCDLRGLQTRLVFEREGFGESTALPKTHPH